VEKITILIFDDVPKQANTIENYLVDESRSIIVDLVPKIKIQPQTRYFVVDALDFIKRHNPPLVITDIRVPGRERDVPDNILAGWGVKREEYDKGIYKNQEGLLIAKAALSKAARVIIYTQHSSKVRLPFNLRGISPPLETNKTSAKSHKEIIEYTIDEIKHTEIVPTVSKDFLYGCQVKN